MPMASATCARVTPARPSTDASAAARSATARRVRSPRSRRPSGILTTLYVRTYELLHGSFHSNRLVPSRRRRDVMNEIELQAGPIEYEDRGAGPVVVLLHGLLMDATLWSDVVADLSR